jgi:hypothetical protein
VGVLRVGLVLGDAENAELVARLARRGEVVDTPPPLPTGEWNAPIDTIQADSMTEREVIRGWIAEAKEEASRWQPRPCPR